MSVPGRQQCPGTIQTQPEQSLAPAQTTLTLIIQSKAELGNQVCACQASPALGFVASEKVQTNLDLVKSSSSPLSEALKKKVSDRQCGPSPLPGTQRRYRNPVSPVPDMHLPAPK